MEPDVQQQASPRTTIIIPALNEGAVIGQVVRQIMACPALIAKGLTDVLVIDNGSDDETAARARAAGARVVTEPRRGYGRACLAGVIAAADAEIIIQIDGDGSDVPEDIVRVWELVARGQADLAMGSRTHGGAERGALTVQQRAGNAVGALALRTFYGIQVSDLGPLRAIRRSTIFRMDPQEMTYGWSTEQLAKAGRMGLRVVDVPVRYRRRAGGVSKVSGTLRGTVRASARILQTLGAYRHWNPRATIADGVQPATGASPDDPSLQSRIASSLVQPQARDRGVLFIVARLPVLGQTKTRLGAQIGHQAATDLYAAFLADLDARFSVAARQQDYDLCWFVSLPATERLEAFHPFVRSGNVLLRQADDADLAVRLWQGFTALRGRGYRRIIVLGSDSPHIPAATVRAAFAALETADVVIGPAIDGGYYLLGQRGDPADLFTAITMSTTTVCAETQARAQALGLQVAMAPLSFDVDLPEDLVPLHAALEAAPAATADPAPATLAWLQQFASEHGERSGTTHAP